MKAFTLILLLALLWCSVVGEESDYNQWSLPVFACVKDKNLKKFEEDSLEECQTACEVRPKCKSIDFWILNDVHNWCYLNMVANEHTNYFEPCYDNANETIYLELRHRAYDWTSVDVGCVAARFKRFNSLHSFPTSSPDGTDECRQACERRRDCRSVHYQLPNVCTLNKVGRAHLAFQSPCQNADCSTVAFFYELRRKR